MQQNNPNLVVGSIWARGSNASTVLAVSNEGLSPEVLENYPQQVVFLTSKFKVLTQPIEMFVSSRTYQGIDANIESLMAAVTAEPDPEADDVDIESIDLGDETDVDESSVAEEEASEETIPVFEPPQFAGLNLDSHFLSYNESPYHTGDTLHVLRFALSNELSIAQLRSVFRVSSDNSIESFVVDSVEERVSVDIYAFVQVFLEVGAGGDAVGCVYVLSQGDFRGKQAGANAEGKVEEPAPEQPVLIPQLSVVSQVEVAHQQV